MANTDRYYYFQLNDHNNPTKIKIASKPINISIMRGYRELSVEQKNFYLEHPDATLYEIVNCRLNPTPEPIDPLAQVKSNKIGDIDNYDMSSSVNGFYYNNQFMWLDRDTRACLRNTIESLEIMSMNELNIWYNDIHITLDLNSAKQLLSALEVYAMQCYNVTASHKVEVNSMTTVDEVESFDITSDYPEMLHFIE